LFCTLVDDASLYLSFFCPFFKLVMACFLILFRYFLFLSIVSGTGGFFGIASESGFFSSWLVLYLPLYLKLYLVFWVLL